MSNTIDIYNSNLKSGRGRKIGVDKGFENQLTTLDSSKPGTKPYINRRALHYWYFGVIVCW